ncbi:MAG: flippase-like domain-containing protein [Candidatus Zixiibacteriota bacterium]|nr:MAG: flippase-like domain-containing protein [candidate division Zixibacteria bacterium]
MKRYSKNSWAGPEIDKPAVNTLNQKNKLRLRLNHLFKIILIILPLALAGNIVYTLLSSELDMLVELLEFKIGYLFLAAFLCVVPWFAQSLRIIIWSRVFKRPVSPPQALQAVLSSDIAAAATPTMLGGGYAKAGYLVSYGFSAGEATIITLLGTIEDAVFFLIALPTSILWSRAWDNPYVRQAGASLVSHWPTVLIVAAIISMAFVGIKKIGKRRISDANPGSSENKISFRYRFLSSLRRYKTDLVFAMKFALTRGKLSFLFTVLAAGIGWCSRYGAISALVLGLGLDADPVLFFLLQWVVFSIMTMIPTPGAIGGAEVSFALVYGGLIPSFAIPVVTSGWRFITFYLPVGLGSLIFAVIGGTALKKKNYNDIIKSDDVKPVVYSESSGK